MSRLPTQLKWSRFKCVLKHLGYVPHPAGGGVGKGLYGEGKKPPIVTFHEPHGSDTIRQGTLGEYLRKLGIDRGEFEALLVKC